jgi:arsenical pump membrane protein
MMPWIVALAGRVTVTQAIGDVSWSLGEFVIAMTVLVGTNIGPALTTYGSLATMLWLTLVRRNGIDVTTGGYLRVSLITVPIVLLTTSATLWLVLVL